MRKVVSFMHISLDGFVAGPGGEMDWVHVDNQIFDYAGRMTDQSDVALYGRVTYEMMDGYWPTAGDQPDASKHDVQHSTWYNKVDKVVLSRTMPPGTVGKRTVIGENVPAAIRRLKEQKGGSIVLFGSPGASHTLLHENLIDEYWLFVNPVLLGQGIRLFESIDKRIALKLVEEKMFESGVALLHYEKK